MENQDTTLLYMDRKKQKVVVKPYRKYQLLLLLLIVIVFILFVILLSLNSTLNYYLREHDKVLSDLESEKDLSEFLVEQDKRINVSYSSLYGLEQSLNIEIIRNMEELVLISGFIDKSDAIEFMPCYKASVEGDDPNTFRTNCRGMGPVLLLIETVDGYRFGGYTIHDFMEDENTYKEDEEAFIFSLDTRKKYMINKPTEAVGDFDNNFPIFGDDDIHLMKGCLSQNNSYAEFPKSYKEDINAPCCYPLTGGKKTFQVKEIEVLIVHQNIYY